MLHAWPVEEVVGQRGTAADGKVVGHNVGFVIIIVIVIVFVEVKVVVLAATEATTAAGVAGWSVR